MIFLEEKKKKGVDFELLCTLFRTITEIPWGGEKWDREIEKSGAREIREIW